MWVEPASYAALLRTAYSVVDVRITRTVSALDDCFAGWDHTVTILRVVKQSESISAEQSTLTFRQLYWAGEREPYPVGAELVLALSKTRDRIERAGGPMGVFIVKGNAGQLIGPWTVGSSYNGMELNAFLAELGRLAR
jgi:hypothetical protein